MQDKKSGLSHIMQEVQPTVCWKNGERPPRQDERTPLQHKNKENRKKNCSPLLPTGGLASEGDQEDPQEQHTVKRERQLHPQNVVPSRAEPGRMTSWHTLSQRTLIHGIRHEQLTLSYHFCILATTEHFALSVLYRVSSIVYLKKVLRD